MTRATSTGTLAEADAAFAAEPPVSPDVADLEEARLLPIATDVETLGGRPLALRRAGEFTEEEVAAAYGIESIIEAGGPPGTIVIADARCLWSDGRPGVHGSLSLASRFSSSLFGAPGRPVPFDHDAPGGFAQMVERCPRTYQRCLEGRLCPPR